MDVDTIKKEIEEYVETILFQHDLAVGRNAHNQEIKNKIVTKCFTDLERHRLSEMIENKCQIHYFVRQSILYLVCP